MKYLRYPVTLVITIVVLFSFSTGKEYKKQMDHSIDQDHSIDKWDMLIQSGANMKTMRAVVKVNWAETFDNRRKFQVQ